MRTPDQFACELIDEHLSSSSVIRVASQFALGNIQGLECYYDFVESDLEQDLLRRIDDSPWSTELERRVQHYGYKYDYKARRIDDSMRIGRPPVWLAAIGDKLMAAGIFEYAPDQIIVNEYRPGQGISPHIDCKPCFGDTVASLSLGSGCVMEFSALSDGAKCPVYLEPRSLIVLKGDSRYRWRHSIPKRLIDTFAGVNVSRSRRVSLTFRNVLWSDALTDHVARAG